MVEVDGMHVYVLYCIVSGRSLVSKTVVGQELLNQDMAYQTQLLSIFPHGSGVS